MPLPDDFSPWEHLREQLTVAHNLDVERSFFGIEANDISTVFGAMRTAVFIQDDDTVDMIILRLFLYHFKFRKDLPTPIFGLSAPDFQAEVTYRPLVTLFFIEPYTQELATEKLTQATAQVSFRLIHETSKSINSEKALILAEKIKEFFGQGMGYVWTKGKNTYTYTDRTHGYNLKILAESEADAAGVITRICDVNSTPFEEDLIKTHLDKKTYPNNPGFHLVYGQEVKQPRKKPTTRVRFTRAELQIWGLTHAISLVDLSRKTIPLVR